MKNIQKLVETEFLRRSTPEEINDMFRQLKAKIDNIESICEEWFRDPMVQPHPGANHECMFCGCTRDKDGGEHHSYADCPHLKYLEHKGELE